MKELLTDYNLQTIKKNKTLLIKPLQRIFESIQKCQNPNFNDFAEKIKENQKKALTNLKFKNNLPCFCAREVILFLIILLSDSIVTVISQG